MNSEINWEEVLDKNARGIDNYDLGEVQKVQDNVVVTQKGVLDKDKLYQNLALTRQFLLLPNVGMTDEFVVTIMIQHEINGFEFKK
jgi:hypothetical protein